MKKLVVLLLASLVATSAFAVIDPDPDMLGIYFDTSADINVKVTPANVPFDLYLIATMPTPSMINAYEFNYEVMAPVGKDFYQLLNQKGDGIIGAVGVGDGIDNKWGGDYAIGLDDPGLPTSEAMVIHKWTYMQIGTPFPMNLFVRANSLPSINGATTPILQDALPDGEPGVRLYTVGTSTGGPDIPVAIVNPIELDPDTEEWPVDEADWVFITDPAGPVAVETSSFGSVKSLFR